VCVVLHTGVHNACMRVGRLIVCGAADGSGWMVVKVDGVVMLIVWLGDEHGR